MIARRLSQEARTLFVSFAPAHNDHHVAARAAFGVFIPLSLCLLSGRLELAIFAAFAAFTGIYGRNEPHAQRLVTQARAGALLFGVILLASVLARLVPGGSFSHGTLSPWLLVAATSVVSALASIVAGFWRLRPTGSLFQIFGFAAIASLPQQPPLADVVLVLAGTVLLCLFIGISSRLSREHRTPMNPASVSAAARLRFTDQERRAIWLEGIGHFLAPAIAGAIATSVGQAMGFGHNYWAMVASVVPLVGRTNRHRVSRGLQRVAGTVVGLGLLALIVALSPEPWAMVIMISLCQFMAELVVLRQYFLAQVFVTPLALLSTLLVTTGRPWNLFLDRIIDTVIGSAVGILVVLVPWAWAKWRARG